MSQKSSNDTSSYYTSSSKPSEDGALNDHNFIAYIKKLPNEIVERVILYLTQDDLKTLFMYFVAEHLKTNNGRLTPIRDPLILKCLQPNSLRIWKTFQFKQTDILSGQFEAMLYILDSILSQNVKKSIRLEYYTEGEKRSTVRGEREANNLKIKICFENIFKLGFEIGFLRSFTHQTRMTLGFEHI